MRSQSVSGLPTIRELVTISAFHRTNVRCRLKSLLDERVGLKAASEPRVIYPVRRRFRPGDESAIELSLRSHPWPGLPGWTCVCFTFILAHDDHQSFSFLFRLCQPRNNCSKLIEYLVPAL